MSIGVTLMSFLPQPSTPATFTAPCSSMIASQREGSLQVSLSSIPLYRKAKVCCVISNKVLPSSPGRQPRATATNLHFWGRLWGLSGQQLLGRRPTPGTEIFSDTFLNLGQSPSHDHSCALPFSECLHTGASRNPEWSQCLLVQIL